MHQNVETFKNLYKDGYRCIHKEKGDGCTFTLRDFKYGKINEINTSNDMEIGEIEDFLDQLKEIRQKTGHDCICTGYETDN